MEVVELSVGNGSEIGGKVKVGVTIVIEDKPLVS